MSVFTNKRENKKRIYYVSIYKQARKKKNLQCQYLQTCDNVDTKVKRYKVDKLVPTKKSSSQLFCRP